MKFVTATDAYSLSGDDGLHHLSDEETEELQELFVRVFVKGYRLALVCNFSVDMSISLVCACSCTLYTLYVCLLCGPICLPVFEYK